MNKISIKLSRLRDELTGFDSIIKELDEMEKEVGGASWAELERNQPSANAIRGASAQPDNCRVAFFKWVETQNSNDLIYYEGLLTVFRAGAAWQAGQDKPPVDEQGMREKILEVADFEGDRATDEQVEAWLVTELDIQESKGNRLDGDHWDKAYARCNAAAIRRLIDIYYCYAAGEPSAPPQINTATESCGGIPPFFKDIICKLEFSANQCELWEEPEDASIVACEYRSLSDKLKNWMEKHGR